eukprot:m.14265 g.14265  ORF g.14265 m.14265 type:complete len:54 (+) comp22046_c0_seq1:1191-1352(+)
MRGSFPLSLSVCEGLRAVFLSPAVRSPDEGEINAARIQKTNVDVEEKGSCGGV